jgi:predicted permease
MRSLVDDISYGFRMMAKTPMLTAVLAMTLAFGIGANALIFSLVNGFLLRPLPVTHPAEIAVLAAGQKGDLTLSYSFSYPEFADFRTQSASFAELFGYTLGLRGFTSDHHADQVLIAFVTGGYFPVLGIQPVRGRLIQPSEENQPGRQSAIVLGYSYWQKRFGGDPSVIGKQVRVNGRSASIVGIVPQQFTGTQMLVEPAMYMPLTASPDDRSTRILTVLARLKPGVSFAQSQSSVDVIAARLARQYPKTDGKVTVRVYREPAARPFPVGNNVVPTIAGFFLILAALLLGLACMNVTNILLARATARQREMGLRAALGARRGRLIRQTLTETMLLGLAGGLLGMLAGAWLIPPDASRFGPSNLAVHLELGFGWSVFIYSLAATLFAGLLVGVWPAFRASRADLNSVLQEGGRGETDGGRRQRMRSALVIAQVAGSLMLLVVAGLFVRSLRHAETMYLGFDPDHLLNVTIDPNAVAYDQPRTIEFYRQLKARVMALPGVESASEAYAVPMGGTNAAYAASISIEGQPLGRDQQPPFLFFNNVDASYFQTMRIPLLRGRVFTDLDDASSTPVAIVNQYMADRFWPNQDVQGKRFTFKSPYGPPKTVEIVGVAANGKYIFIGEGPDPYFYVPLAQNFTSMRALQIRSSGAPEMLVAPVQQVIRSLAPELPVVQADTMRQTLGGATGLWFYRIGAQLASVIGGIGLILAMVGLYGLVSFNAAQRTREIGIRMALGGSTRDVSGLILRQGARLVVIGLGVGVVAAFGVTRVMTRLLVGVSPSDPLTYAGVALLLSAVALLACWIPARRATHVDPCVALRYE